MNATVTIAEFEGGAHVGTICDQCANRADVVLVRGPESMALCSDCTPKESK